VDSDPDPFPGPRRISRRTHYQVEVSVESDHNFYTGITRDLSEGGVFVATFDPPQVGSVVELDLKLPNVEAPFHMVGVVRWRRECEAASDGLPTGCGIEWREIGCAALTAIQEFVCVRDTLFFEAA
jgi:uncharacterized protein (TIGR02266 family)